MPKKKPPTHEPFEGKSDHGKFTKICDSMIDSDAWKSLEPSQMGLYLLIKRKFTKNKTGDDNRQNVSFPFSEYKKIRTYSNQRTFWRDLDALIEHGFIEVVSSGKPTREPTIYGFSELWKCYGTPAFQVADSKRRQSQKRK
jgi:hypothetical protein